MPTYLLLQQASDYSASAMLMAGSDGARNQTEAIRSLGGEVLAQYALVGRYDVALIVDLPDEETCLALSLRSTEDGFMTEVLRAFPADAVDRAADKLRNLEKREIGGARGSQSVGPDAHA